LSNRRRNGQRDVPDAVFPLAVFLPDALRDDSDLVLGLVVWKECAAECRVGAKSEADDAGNFSHGLTRMEEDWSGRLAPIGLGGMPCAGGPGNRRFVRMKVKA